MLDESMRIKESALIFDSVTAGYRRGVPILHDVRIAFPKGTVSTIVGPNGAGKSTLLNTAAGLVRVFEGTVSCASVDITRLPVYRRVLAGVALCAQGRNNFPKLSVADNLKVASSIDRSIGPQELDKVLDLFPVIRQKWYAPAGSLSGGQQQVLELVMSLISGPDVLLIDEPSMGLSPNHFVPVLEGIRSIADAGRTVVMVEQNAKLGLSISDYGVVLVRGNVVAFEKASTLAESDSLRNHLIGNG